MNIKPIILIHVLVIITTICTYTFLFDYPAPIILLSLFVIFCLYAFSTWVLIFCKFFTKCNSLIDNLMTSSILTATTGSILFILVINFVSNSNWGTNVTLDFIIRYSRQLSGLEDSLPIPLSMIYVLLILITGGIFTFYYNNLETISRHISLIPDYTISASTPVKNKIYIASSLLVIPFFLFVYEYTQSNYATDMWDGEPLTDLFLPHTTITLDQTTDKFTLKNDYYANMPDGKNEKPNIILIIADALRADHIGAYGYKRPTTKFLDSLISSNKAIKIENAFSTCSESNCGILSSLTSRPFEEISKDNISINKVLKDLGYDVNFILSADHTWAGLKEHYPPYDLFYDSNMEDKKIIIDDQLVLNRLSEIPSYKKPSFFYFHLMSNHSAGHRKKKFAQFTPYKSPNDWFYRLPIIKNLLSTDTESLEKNFYDNGVISTDYYISQIYNQLNKKGYLKNSIIWIVADHGEALGEHGHYGHIESLYNEEIKIPMIIIDNKKELYQERNFATQLDIAPTILDRLGVNIPSGWKGVSLLQKKPESYTTYHNIPDRSGEKAIIMKGKHMSLYKMIYHENPLKIKAIYNLNNDIEEKNNLNNSENKSLVYILKEKVNQKSIMLSNNH